jgi:hypothetical protein
VKLHHRSHLLLETTVRPTIAYYGGHTYARVGRRSAALVQLDATAVGPEHDHVDA